MMKSWKAEKLYYEMYLMDRQKCLLDTFGGPGGI